MQVSALLNGLLDHISRDKALKKKSGPAVCSCLLSQWRLLVGWLEGEFNLDHRLAAISLLRKLLALEPSVSLPHLSVVIVQLMRVIIRPTLVSESLAPCSFFIKLLNLRET